MNCEMTFVVPATMQTPIAGGLKEAPVDAVIIGIVDTVDVLGKVVYSAKQ